MKNRLFCTFCLSILALQLSAIDVSLTHCTFSSGQGSYVEVYIRVSANSVEYKLMEDSLFQASILGLILLKKDDEIINADKFTILSPPTKDKKDFWSSRRYKIEPGEYKLEYTLSDQYNEENTINEQRAIKVDTRQADKVSSSGILLMASLDKDDDLPFGKYGYGFEPLAYDIVTPASEKLIFNWEIYGHNVIEEELYLSYTIYNGYTGTLGEKLLQKHMKLKKEPVEIILKEMPILDLHSGAYHLTLEVYNKELKQVHYKEKNFAMVQPVSDFRNLATYDKEFENSFVGIMNEEEVEYSLRALNTQLEGNMVETLNNILATGSLESKKYFLYSHWQNLSPDQPGEAYKAYMKVIRAVDDEFSSHRGYGFETDRGYIFMKYGRPNDIVDVVDEVNAPPYSIWIYLDFPATQQSNVKFLFYNPSLSGDDFILLHSNCTAEVQNVQWEQVLYSNAYNERIGNPIDGTQMQDNFNRKASRFFSDN